jgi:hypothetical protein
VHIGLRCRIRAKAKSKRSKTPWRHTVNEGRLRRAKMARLVSPTFEGGILSSEALRSAVWMRHVMVHSTLTKDAIAALGLDTPVEPPLTASWV